MPQVTGRTAARSREEPGSWPLPEPLPRRQRAKQSVVLKTCHSSTILSNGAVQSWSVGEAVPFLKWGSPFPGQDALSTDSREPQLSSESQV